MSKQPVQTVGLQLKEDGQQDDGMRYHVLLPVHIQIIDAGAPLVIDCLHLARGQMKRVAEEERDVKAFEDETESTERSGEVTREFKGPQPGDAQGVLLNGQVGVAGKVGGVRAHGEEELKNTKLWGFHSNPWFL